LEALAAFSLERSVVADQKIEEQVNFLEETKATLNETHGKAIEFAEVLGRLPNAERRLNQQVKRSRNEISTVAGNIEKIVASISRAIATYGSAR
jgi:methylthioribose-1-phosphate isomerase